jgi:hypothetical protein
MNMVSDEVVIKMVKDRFNGLVAETEIHSSYVTRALIFMEITHYVEKCFKACHNEVK